MEVRFIALPMGLINSTTENLVLLLRVFFQWRCCCRRLDASPVALKR